MPKQPTFEKRYPTLQKPLNIQRKPEAHTGLRNKTNIQSETLDSSANNSNGYNNAIKNKQNFTPNYIASSSITGNSNSSHIVVTNYDLFYDVHQENLSLGEFEDDLQNSVSDDNIDLTMKDSNLLYSIPTSPTTFLLNQDSSDEVSSDEDDNLDDNDSTHISTGQKRYHDNHSELPKYTGDGGPIFRV